MYPNAYRQECACDHWAWQPQQGQGGQDQACSAAVLEAERIQVRLQSIKMVIILYTGPFCSGQSEGHFVLSPAVSCVFVYFVQV